MVGLGTIINTAAVAAGGIIGLFGGKLIKERIQDGIQTACGVAVLFIGISGALEKIMTVNDGAISSGKSMMYTLCIVLGAVIGEIINIDGLFEKFGAWLKVKTRSTDDAGFIDGFVTASLTLSIGAMAIVGAIQDGISGDYSILVSKSVLDFVLVMVMTCSMGKGCIFSAIPIFVFEGGMTALAVVLKPIMTDLALSYISLIGNILIFCVGVNIVWKLKIRVANMLPALVFAVIAALAGL